MVVRNKVSSGLIIITSNSLEIVLVLIKLNGKNK